jgi:predicted RNA-binding protein with PUA-like domain
MVLRHRAPGQSQAGDSSGDDSSERHAGKARARRGEGQSGRTGLIGREERPTIDIATFSTNGAAMAHWLVKSEPETWSWDSHLKAGADAWTGVRNHQAKLHLAAMKVGDRVFFYHSGEVRAVVGVTEVVRTAYPDPTDSSGAFVCVDLKAVAPLKQPVSLAAIKAEPRLKDMVLVKNSRLSVQPVTEQEWSLIARMGDG